MTKSKVVTLTAFAIFSLAAILGDSQEEELFSIRVRSLNIGGEVSFDDIVHIDAELHNTPTLALRQERIDRFRVPREHNREILRFISNPKLDTLPALDIFEIGSLKLEDSRGKVRTVVIFWTGGKSPLNYSLNGLRCISKSQVYPNSDDALTLDRLIRKIHASAK